MHPEKQITPPPSPEAITSDKGAARQGTAAGEQSAARTTARSGSADAPNLGAVMNSDSSNDRPWNKEKGGKRYGLE